MDAASPPPPQGPASIVVINMDGDGDRLTYMKAQLDNAGLPFARFPAVIGAALPAELRAYFPPEEDGTGFLSKGEIGCYASHLAVYRAIADGRIAAPALVLEDDVEAPNNLSAMLARVIALAPPGWDFVRLTSPAKRAYVSVAHIDDAHTLVRYSVSPGSNGAMLVSQAGARKFLKRELRRLPIDQDNRRLWDFDLNLYGVTPAPIRGNAFGESTIDGLAGRSREERSRQRRLRAERQLWRRHAYNIGAFGFAGWIASEIVSVWAMLMPRRSRPAFLARMGWRLQRIAKAPR